MPPPTASRTCGAQADVDVPPEQRPGGADFGHIDLAHQRALKRQVLLESLQRIGGIDDVAVTFARGVAAGLPIRRRDRRGAGRRHRLAHPRQPARRCRRPRRTLCRPQSPGHPRRRSATRDRCRGSGRAGSSRAALPVAVDLVQPADGVVRVLARPEPVSRGRRGSRASRGRTTPSHGRSRVIPRTRSSRSGWERVSSRWMPAASGRCTASPPIRCRALVTSRLRDLQRRRAQSTRRRGISTSTAAWACSPRRSAISAAGRRGSPPSNPIRVRPSTPARTSPSGSVRAPRRRGSIGGSQRASAMHPLAERRRLSRGVVVLDPPRSGAGRDVVEGDRRPRARRRSSTSRAIRWRSRATWRPSASVGYDTTAIDAIDLFPNSHHLEAVAVLDRAAPGV